MPTTVTPTPGATVPTTHPFSIDLPGHQTRIATTEGNARATMGRLAAQAPIGLHGQISFHGEPIIEARVTALGWEAIRLTDPRCTTCGRNQEAPYRRVVRGRVVEGCVDRFHGLVDSWARRPEAELARSPETV